MSKTTTTNGGANGAAASGDWMSILRINKKDLIILSKKVNLKFDTNLAIPDPLQRLVVTLRYLVTGEGYHVDLAETFMGTYCSIFAALESNLEVSIILISLLLFLTESTLLLRTVARIKEGV